jgi:hypothetical protein
MTMPTRVQKDVSTSAVVVQAKPSANSSRPKMIMVAPGMASVSRPATGKMKASMMPAGAPRLVAAGIGEGYMRARVGGRSAITVLMLFRDRGPQAPLAHVNALT